MSDDEIADYLIDGSITTEFVGRMNQLILTERLRTCDKYPAAGVILFNKVNYYGRINQIASGLMTK